MHGISTAVRADRPGERVLRAGVHAPPRLANYIRWVSVVLLLVWLIGNAVRTYPFHLAYFNEFVGGPANGYKNLATTDLDWGQDLGNLATFLRQNGITTIKLAYFGTDDPKMYGIRYEHLVPGVPASGVLAVSAYFFTAGCGPFAWLKPYEPVAAIGYTIFVYYIQSGAKLPPAKPLSPGCLALVRLR